ncbi:MAG: hypothetical protein AB1714_02830 [Acidobacteriota bacterium]
MKESNLLNWSIPLLVGMLTLGYMVFNWPALALSFADLVGAIL